MSAPGKALLGLHYVLPYCERVANFHKGAETEKTEVEEDDGLGLSMPKKRCKRMEVSELWKRSKLGKKAPSQDYGHLWWAPKPTWTTAAARRGDLSCGRGGALGWPEIKKKNKNGRNSWMQSPQLSIASKIECLGPASPLLPILLPLAPRAPQGCPFPAAGLPAIFFFFNLRRPRIFYGCWIVSDFTQVSPALVDDVIFSYEVAMTILIPTEKGPLFPCHGTEG